MSTPFSSISKLMYNEMKKSEVFTSMDVEVATDYLSDLIIEGATLDFSTCRKDLEDLIEYREKEINKKIESDCESIITDISQVDELLRNEIVIYVNDVQVEDFTYNIVDNSCTINYDFKQDDYVRIIFCFEGEFKADLTYREKYIIALSAYYHYLCGKVKEENTWFKKLGDKDYSFQRGTLNDYISLQNKVNSNIRNYIRQYEQQMATVEDFM